MNRYIRFIVALAAGIGFVAAVSWIQIEYTILYFVVASVSSFSDVGWV